MLIDYQTFPSGKKYAFVRDGKNKVFLRNIAFLHSTDPNKILLVHEWGASKTKEWEPPKGQMEWKEFEEFHFRRNQTIHANELANVMRDGMLRELFEEAKVTNKDIRNFHILPLSYSEEFPAAGKNAVFRYQFWEGVLTADGYNEAQKRFRTLMKNPEKWKDIPADKKEKDAIIVWNPVGNGDSWKMIRGEFSGTMTRMYYNYVKMYKK